MKRIKSKCPIIIVTLLCIIIFGINPNNVNAATYAPAPDSFYYSYTGDQFCFNRKTGEYKNHTANYCGSKTTYGVEKVKYFNSSNQKNSVYCAEWDRDIDDITKHYYKYDTSFWNPTSERAVVVGNISYQFNPNNTITMGNYAKIGATLNHYLATDNNIVHLLGSHNFSSLASNYSTLITKAKSYYQSVKNNMTVTTLAKPKYSTTSPTMDYGQVSNSTGSYHRFSSEKITVSNLNTTQYGDKVTYKISISSNNSNAEIALCTYSGSTCNGGKDYVSSISKDITSDIVEGKYIFKLMIRGKNDADIHDAKVNIKISASNSSTYYTSYLYYSGKSKSSYQRLVYPGTINVSRASTNSLSIIVPDLNNYSVYINKVDSNGDSLKGAKFKLTNNGEELNLTDNGDGTFVWKTEKTPDSSYDFSKLKLEEVSTPNGYIYNSNPISFKNISKTETCVNTENDEEVDINLCHPEKYSYKCVNANGEIASDRNPDNDCASTSTDDTTTQDSYTKKCYQDTNQVDDKYCSSKNNYTLFTKNGNSISITVTNNQNSVTISKRATTGNDEVPGAQLKICTESSYNTSNTNCEAVKNISNETLSWTSSDTPKTWRGINKGSYVIVETVTPDGYIKSETTATKFSIDETGKITSNSLETVKDGDSNKEIIIVKNKANSLSISKQDIATGKELPGAKISICQAITEDNEVEDNVSDEEGSNNDNSEENNNIEDEIIGEYDNTDMVVDKNTGECIPVQLADGTEATWISTEEPKTITGLPAGTYYLVEKTAPKGYSTAESILFTMNEDGTLTDVLGNSLVDNKLVMLDFKMTDVKTGELPIIIATILGLGAVGFGSYYYAKTKKDNNKSKIKSVVTSKKTSGKVRKRKIYKK